jgi:hypothetical protein
MKYQSRLMKKPELMAIRNLNSFYSFACAVRQ